MSAVANSTLPSFKPGDRVRLDLSKMDKDVRYYLTTNNEPVGVVTGLVYDEYFDADVVCIRWPSIGGLSNKWHPRYLRHVNEERTSHA